MEKLNSIFFKRFKYLFTGAKKQAILLSKTLLFIFSLSGFMKHPYYVSVTEIKQNAKGNLELSSRIFTDNLEKALKQSYGKAIDLVHPENKKLCDSLIENYLGNHFAVWVDEAPVELDYLGYEKDEDAVLIYMESKPVKKPGVVKVKNKLLYEAYHDQINMMHVTIGSSRKSTKISAPETAAYFKFSK
jgi:hypothetical protein